MAKLIIRRKRNFVGCIREFKVIVDGLEAGRVKNGRQLVLDLNAGEHELFLKMDFSRSKKLRFSVAEGAEIFFTCEPGFLGLKLQASEAFEVNQVQSSDNGLDLTLEFNWQTLVTLLLFIAALGLIIARTYAYMQLEMIKTVDHLAFSGEEVCIHHDQTLYTLTPGGWLRDRVALAELGISGTPADLEYTGDGRLLVGDYDSKDIYLCDLDARSCEPVKFSKWVAIRDNFKFTYDKENNLLYVIDTNRHSLAVNSMSRPESMSFPGIKLSYPNDLILGKNGSLLIADTKNTRITSVELDGSTSGYKEQLDLINMAGYSEPSTSFAGVEGFTEKVAAGAVSSFPSPLALTDSYDGNLWVVVSDAYINYGEIWKFGQDGERLDKVSLSKRSIPQDIIRVGKKLLVSDSEENQVYSIDPVSGRISIFGDERFQQILTETRQNRDNYRQIKNNSFKYIAVLLAALVLMLMVHKRSQAAKLKGK